MYKWIICAALLVSACGSDSSGPAPIEVEGTWTGGFTFDSGNPGTLTMTLQETSGAVTGNGNITGPGGSNALTVTGTYSEPNVALSLAASGFADISLTGVVGTGQLTGTLQGSGFQGATITLNRQ